LKRIDEEFLNTPLKRTIDQPFVLLQRGQNLQTRGRHYSGELIRERMDHVICVIAVRDVAREEEAYNLCPIVACLD
jgi:hypothetical protein